MLQEGQFGIYKEKKSLIIMHINKIVEKEKNKTEKSFSPMAAHTMV